MAVNGVAPRIQNIIQHPNQDGRTAFPSPAQSPRRGTAPTSVHAEIPLQDQPIFGPPRPEEMVDSTTDSQINLLLRTVKHPITLAEEKNKRISELEQSKRQLIHICDTPSPPRRRRGRSPRRSRSRSPRRSVSVRSPSRGQRSLRRSPPRWSPPRRSPPRRNRCSWPSSSSSSDDERDTRGVRYRYSPFTWCIRDTPIPRGLEKPPQMDSYDGTSDPDEHIENIEVVLTYRSVRGAVKCKLFVTTLRRGAMTWFKNLRRNSIDTWGDLCHVFTTHFTASRT